MAHGNDSACSADVLLAESSGEGEGIEEILAALDTIPRREQNKWRGIADFNFKIKSDQCNRCNRKVYPVEKVDIGVPYHRGCFKCRICSVQLTLRTFQREIVPGSNQTKEVYCNGHVPRQIKTHVDQDAMAIRLAMEAQKKTSIKNERAQGSRYGEGWAFSAPDKDGSGVQVEVEEVQEAAGAAAAGHQLDTLPAKQYFQGLTVRRRPTLRSFQDFEKYGIFEAQQALEKLHRKEEDELYKQIFAERQQHIRNLDERFKIEKERSVRDLISWFEQKGASQHEKENALNKLDLYFKKQRDEKMKQLLMELATEEQAAVGRMIEKHSQEMLQLIAEKEKKLVVDIPIDSKQEPRERKEEEPVEPVIERPLPPATHKSMLYDTPDVFEEFDKQAIEESKKEHRTFTDLVRRLSNKCQTELQKVRALFRWVTVKDLNKMHFDTDIDPDSPIGLLRGIKYGTESYHDLFKRLCSYAGIHCEVIDGHSKGAGYRPGTRISQRMFRNQWTAVLVDGSWRFVNCNWGARHVKGPRRDNVHPSDLHYKCDEFYFLTDPENHIYQHFPFDSQWQLLKEPLTMEQFLNLPVVKSPFFNNRLSFYYDYEAILETNTGLQEIRLKMPRLVPLAAKLTAPDKDIPAESLQDRILIRTIENEVAIVANLPYPARYYLDIFVGSDWKSESMDSACSFQINGNGVSVDANMLYPPVGCFGRTPYFKRLGFSEKTNIDPYVINEGSSKIALSLSKDVKLSHSFRLWDQRSNNMVEYDRFAFIRHQGDSFASLEAQCPRRGLYVFSIYACLRDSLEESPNMRCVFRYLIRCKSQMHNAVPFPKSSKRWKWCKLHEPLSGYLPLDSSINFKLESARALEIVVSVNDIWYPLEKEGHYWTGIVPTGSSQGRALTYGRFESNAEKYVPLLEFQIKDTSKMGWV